eukprot:TRINITY_DN11839_c0_g1_i1.p1 TRINITY_DN11839_c0_g1~~TRINITY_DN11839_c0_g1_i1.p1  ORF type:complete len:312 (+),score=52.02 TRINITY_DN11839_c0_g1_i1:185-1120(+)
MSYDANPFDEGDARPYGGSRAPGSSAYASGGSFYDNNPNLVAPVTSKPLPLPPEPLNSGVSDATDEIPLGNKSDYKKRERELKAKEDELKKKELELKRREEAAARAGILIDVKNWPPFFPIIHHDISKDIPEHLRTMMVFAFYSWLGIMLCLLWNFISVITAWVTRTKGVEGSDGLEVFFMSLIYFVAGVPLSYWLWYKRLYNAFRKDRALTFAWFFLMYLIHLAFCIFAAVSPPFLFKSRSLTGLIAVLQIFSDGKTIAGIFYATGFCLWTVECLISLYVLKNVYFYFRGSGKAAELKRDAASSAIRAAV